MNDLDMLRLERMRWCWGEETNDPETQKWREDLTEDEQRLVDSWDDGFEDGVLRMVSERSSGSNCILNSGAKMDGGSDNE